VSASYFAAIIPAAIVAMMWDNRSTEGDAALTVELAAITTALVSVPALRFVVGRQEHDPWRFLGVARVPARAFVLPLAATAVFIAASDLLAVALGRPLVPDSMTEMYVAATSRVLLAVGLVLAAPVVEELFFRGFLLTGMRACGAPLVLAVVVVSLLFTLIHMQYEAYDLVHVFLLSVGFAIVRVRFDSVLPCIAMHAMANAIGFAETAFLVSRAS
jgi:uncharacterized protein